MSLFAEKRGTSNWVQCAGCTKWFHISASLLARPDVKVHCPHCHNEFLQRDAARLVKGG
jgi:predicted Zn finger-like uncharacterized protein